MRVRSLSQLSNGALLSALDEAEARDRSGTVELLHYLAEVDRRRLYAPAGYPSMFDWCVKTRHYSEAMASRRIAAARAARRFPEIRDMIADGRLHLTAIALLSKKLTEHNASELLAAAVHKSRRQIEVLLAERFPQPDMATQLRNIEVANFPPSPVTVNFCAHDARSAVLTASESQPSACPDDANAPGGTRDSAMASADTPPAGAAALVPTPLAAPSRVAPLAPQRFGVQFTMDEAMHADLARALALLAPRRAEDRVREVFRRALRELVTKLEKQKFAATSRPKAVPAPRSSAGVETGVQPRPAARSEAGSRPGARSADARHIPAAVRREVWARDQGRCTFVGTTGHRCEAQDALEFDHVVPVARGGRSTAENLRLLCRAHNQHEAEQVFGEGLMHGIRERARDGVARARSGP